MLKLLSGLVLSCVARRAAEAESPPAPGSPGLDTEQKEQVVAAWLAARDRAAPPDEEIKMHATHFGSIKSDERVTVSFMSGAWHFPDKNRRRVEVRIGKGAAGALARILCDPAAGDGRCGCRIDGTCGSVAAKWRRGPGGGWLCMIDTHGADGVRRSELLIGQAEHLGQVILRHAEARP